MDPLLPASGIEAPGIKVKVLDATFHLALSNSKRPIVELLCQIYPRISYLPLSHLVAMTPKSIRLDTYHDEISVYDLKEVLLDYALSYDGQEGLLRHLEAIRRYSRPYPELECVYKASRLMLRYAIRLNYMGTMSDYVMSLSQAIHNNWDGNEILEWNEIYKGEIDLRYCVLGPKNEHVHKELTYYLKEFSREKNVYFIHVHMKLASLLAEKEGYPRLYFLLLLFTRELYNREGKDRSELVNLSDEIDITPRNYFFSLDRVEVSRENRLAWIKIILGHLDKKSNTYKQVQLVGRILKQTQDVQGSELYLLLQTASFVERITQRVK
jgi:hypothetical protein